MATIPERSVEFADGTSATVRAAEIIDAPDIVTLFEAGYDDGEGVVGQPGEMTWTVEEQSTRIASSLERDKRLTIVAVVDGDIVGLLDFRAGERKRLAHQGEFAIMVEPRWRGRGVGTCLLTSLLEWAGANGIERIGLTVLSDAERAIALYRKLGFREEGRRVREIKYGPGRYADQVQMALFLDD